MSLVNLWDHCLVSTGILESLVCFSCLCYAIYVYCTHITVPVAYTRRAHVRSISLPLKLMTLCGITSFLMCSISQSTHLWYPDEDGDFTKYAVLQGVTWYGTWLSWSTGIFMTYLLFLHRTRHTFAGSSFSLSQTTL